MSIPASTTGQIEKIETHIPGFDAISQGGIPKNRATMVSGTAGSGKTIFLCQFIANGIQHDNEKAVFVTFEETPESIFRNMMSFGWNLQQWSDEGKLAIIDATPSVETVMSEGYDLEALIHRIEHAVKKVNATRVVVDSLGALLYQFHNTSNVRYELIRLINRLRSLEVTLLVSAERTEEYGDIARYGIEEFITDNVIIFRNILEEEKRRRTMEILKYRGSSHQSGEYPFAILPDKGVFGLSLTTIEINQGIIDERIPTGADELYQMVGGGFFTGSVVLLSGTTGTGKTIMVSEFMRDTVQQSKEMCIFFSFEESREQLVRNAEAVGIDFKGMIDSGLFKLECLYPEVMNIDEHLIHIKRTVEKFKPKVVAVDSLSALERVSNKRSFREFLIGLTAFIKQEHNVTIMLTSSSGLGGTGSTVTESNISSITDAIILLRYVEVDGELKRVMSVLKMRGSQHEKEMREFTITNKGIKVGKPLRKIQGILTGSPQYGS